MVDVNICEDFIQAFHITKPVENDTNLPHPKFARLCPKARLYSRDFGIEKLQQKRRLEHIENIRRKREILLANLRKLVNITEDRPSSPISPQNSLSPEKENNLNNVEMRSVNVESNDSLKISKKRYKQKNKDTFERLVGKQLMLSEWLVDVPEDFYQEWFMVSCPNGRRCIVIAAKGETKVYTKHGRLMTQFQSHLPGGCKKTIQKSKKSTILDCIYVEQMHKFFILDVISWNGCTFFDCDTEFRFFWLGMKFEEEVKAKQEIDFSQNRKSSIFNDSDMDISDDLNSLNSSFDKKDFVSSSSSFNSSMNSVSKLYSFEPLQYFDCTIKNVKNILDSDENFQSQIDGILFYNKHSPYTPGVTPLVCWLKVSMLRDVLKL